MTRRRAILASVWVVAVFAVVTMVASVVRARTDGSEAPRIYIDMTPNKTFNPRAVTAAPGQRVTWLNRDTVPHSVIPDTGHVKGWANSSIKHRKGVRPGSTYNWQVPTDAKPGMVFYYHDQDAGKPGNGQAFGTGMAGSITVR